ncbi:MAG: CRISPR-associated protein Csn1 [Lutibacter sp.]|uniref:type II CRISPR RNA-guided endonuclease Cas9 n=1 Tax=Lutibacter sp. TaxID=1925666 RepID=UPI0019DFD3D5|nr:type II CRISPR RNA-guided endonuclease Cas9 [Lutibacter sp.]NOR27361.1 CRISPR-associated protein Csn1 [Lutibacter sp.]
MKKILGLDLGTNSIGWSLLQTDFNKKEGNIIGVGSRIIPMSQDVLGKFDSGVSISQTAERTGYRGVRRLLQRNLLRRERLHRVLNVLGFLPNHYANSIDFEKHLGQFKDNTEVKLNYRKNTKGKHEFIFMDSFNEMVKEFKANGQEIKIPYDWTLYYLRKKALTKKITKEELAWVILNFNQKRGYYQLRGEEEEIVDGKTKEYIALKVKELIDSGEVIKKTGDKLYDVVFENDWKYDKQIVKTESWSGKTKEFIVTSTVKKDGEIKRTFKAVDSEQDWIAIKTKTEQDIECANKSVGQFIYDTLLQNPTQKIRGKLVKTIERKFYKKEFKQLLETQIKYHSELLNKDLYAKCVNELYPRNEAHQNNIKDKGFEYLFMDDIIFYQRPLKSKKSTISGCTYETRKYKKTIIDKLTKEEKQIWVNEPIKAIPKSHPLFQEFRLWQFLSNLKIYKIQVKEDVDITTELLKTEDDWVDLFDFLNGKKEIEQHQILKYFSDLKLISRQKKDDKNYRWNYVVDKKYPCNETKTQFITRLKKVKNLDVDAFLTPEMEYKLWHIVYSVTDKNEFEQAIKNFAKKIGLDQESFEKNFLKFPPYKSDFGAYSVKAIKKLIPLMRRGKYWAESAINQEVKDRIENIKERLESINYDEEVFKEDKQNKLQSISDDEIPKQFLKSFVVFKDKNHLAGLNTYQACYVVYERHSEAGDLMQWRTPQNITNYLNDFKQHSLRNPIVEQVVTETLRTVRDIWLHYGNSEENFFNEIHIELGREMKNPAEKRKRMSAKVSENENTNQRIKAILQELKDGGVSEVKPYSPSQQEILKIYEEGVYQSIDVTDDIEKIRKSTLPTKAEIYKYKLWLEQGYISPYTGQIIPLSKLFTHQYEIEHVIPQSRYFDNSLSNKVICESEINRDKSNMTAYEYILKKGGSIVDGIKVLSKEHYEKHCENYFKKNRTKLKNLLSEDVPEGFINRQLNDSRYISTLVKGLLSNLVREDNEKEATSKHIVPVTGAITSKLKQDWGLNDKWNELVLPRFIRLNELTNTNNFTAKNTNGVIIPTVPNELSKGFNKKRIDHRHHALDALVIACCTKKHTNYLGALNTENKNFGLRDALLIKNKEGNYTKHFLMPWSNFTSNVKTHLEKTVISFKQNTRVINKTNNKTMQWVEKEGQWKKQLVPQNKGDNWAIRKPMHKETVAGKVTLKREKGLVNLNLAIVNYKMIVDKSIKNKIKVAFVLFDNNVNKVKAHFKKNPIKVADKELKKIAIYENIEATATRTALTDKFTRKHLESITDTGIQKILENHIKNYVDENGKEKFDVAFSSEGVEELNKNIVELNGNKKHQPIYKVRLYEVGSKFNIGLKGNRKDKYVEAAKGTNLFFAIYQDEAGNRKYETIPLNEVIEHQKQVAHLSKNERTEIPVKNVLGSKGKEIPVQFLFSLSPNDLVYVPTNEELDKPTTVNFNNLSKEQVERVYKMVSSSSNQCFFLRNDIATSIWNKKEFSALNKMEKTIDNKMIKGLCWKLKVDRLGSIALAK